MNHRCLGYGRRHCLPLSAMSESINEMKKKENGKMSKR